MLVKLDIRHAKRSFGFWSPGYRVFHFLVSTDRGGFCTDCLAFADGDFDSLPLILFAVEAVLLRNSAVFVVLIIWNTCEAVGEHLPYTAVFVLPYN